VLTVIFFAQRLWFFLWRVTQFSDAHSLRFTCHIVLFFVLLDSLYCGMQLLLRDSVAGLYLATPLVSSVLFYQVYLKINTNVFTAELFGMLSRCVYHSLEAAYCIGVLPLRFLQYEHIYYDASRCLTLTALATLHTFLMLFCLELHCLGSEVLQQTQMLGAWRWIPDPSMLQSMSPKPPEWACQCCPYPRGAVVRCNGRYYEAMATMNTCTPTCSPYFTSPILFVLGDTGRAKVLVLAALMVLNAALVHLILWSNQWSMYAVLLIPNCGHFLYVKCRRSHFFNPAHLNLSQLQWEMHLDTAQQYKLGPNSLATNRSGSQNLADGTWGYRGLPEETLDSKPKEHLGGFGDNHLSAGVAACLQCPNPLFMSAVSASTMFFFGPSGGRSAQELGHPGLPRHDAPRNI